MKRKHYLIITVAVFCGILFLFQRGGDGKKTMTGDEPHGEANVRVRKSFSFGRIISSIGLDPEEREIERDPHMSRQEKDEQRKWYRVHRDGADIKLTFHVTDSMGQDVPDATVEAGFFKNDDRKGETDENGLFTAEGKTWGELTCFVKKDGHYDTRVVYDLDSEDDDVKNGKWVPWHRTIEVTLKEKRNPIPMYVKQAEIILPKTNETFGFDFQIGDLIAPYGEGEKADMQFTYAIKTPVAGKTEYQSNIIFDGMTESDGMVLMHSDLLTNHSSPGFPSVYEAPEESYEQRFEMSYKYTFERIIEKNAMTDNDYLIFRCRTITDDKGQIASAHYGKMYYVRCSGTRKNPDGGLIQMQYYFNPTPNDRNLEFDPDKNLFEERKRGGVYLSP